MYAYFPSNHSIKQNSMGIVLMKDSNLITWSSKHCSTSSKTVMISGLMVVSYEVKEEVASQHTN